MANEIKWIKFIAGCTDGTSFKKMRAAEVDGISYRDKLEAVWFELLDFAAQCNHSGMFIDGSEISYNDDNYKDLAAIINRTPEELQICMNFYIKERMVEVVDGAYSLKNWSKYQSVKSLDEVREQGRVRVQRHREKQAKIEVSRDGNVTENDMSRDGNVTVTLSNAPKNLRTKEYKNKRTKEVKEKENKEIKQHKPTPTRSVPAANVIISIPLNDKTEYGVTQSQINEWTELYPAITVIQELRNMRGWCEANPKRCKTRNGVLRFVHGWLATNQDRANNAPGSKTASPPPAEYDRKAFFKQYGLDVDETISEETNDSS